MRKSFESWRFNLWQRIGSLICGMLIVNNGRNDAGTLSYKDGCLSYKGSFVKKGDSNLMEERVDSPPLSCSYLCIKRFNAQKTDAARLKAPEPDWKPAAEAYAVVAVWRSRSMPLRGGKRSLLCPASMRLSGAQLFY